MGVTGKGARTKGHNLELQICHMLRTMGFDAVTSRSESKRLDDQKVDIFTDAPFNIQAKFVEKLGNLHTILNEIPTNKTPIVMHKRSRQGLLVAMKIEDFLELIKPNDKLYE